VYDERLATVAPAELQRSLKQVLKKAGINTVARPRAIVDTKE
jgi:hypothetical protein